ncbi:unnamed protein product [Pleuronectes platessa]|uniref:Uncharacterized protein n=1 Tax=Pleuronectes platessa TaxID=8262 RepID=A0A9N7VML5_PLEPL|nr:unnamed protein product [Pleuronectes platessa]
MGETSRDRGAIAARWSLGNVNAFQRTRYAPPPAHRSVECPAQDYAKIRRQFNCNLVEEQNMVNLCNLPLTSPRSPFTHPPTHTPSPHHPPLTPPLLRSLRSSPLLPSTHTLSLFSEPQQYHQHHQHHHISLSPLSFTTLFPLSLPPPKPSGSA